MGFVLAAQKMEPETPNFSRSQFDSRSSLFAANSTETLATQANTATERFHRDMKILMFSLSVVC